MDATVPTIPSIPLNDGHAIPQLGFGTWRVGGIHAAGVVAEALRAGYRSVDTAAAYGNEEGVGQGLRDAGLPRGEVFVTTKLWNDRHGYDNALRAFDESRRRLGVEYVDLYLIHWPVPANGRYVDAWKALVELQKEKRVRSIGVSNFNADHLKRIVDATGVTPAVNQVELHPTFQQRALREVHASMGIVTEAWSPLGKGTVLDDPVVAAVAARHGATPAQAILAWHLAQGIVTIPKSSKPERMLDNLRSAALRLSPEDIAAIDALDRDTRVGGDPETFA